MKMLSKKFWYSLCDLGLLVGVWFFAGEDFLSMFQIKSSEIFNISSMFDFISSIILIIFPVTFIYRLFVFAHYFKKDTTVHTKRFWISWLLIIACAGLIVFLSHNISIGLGHYTPPVVVGV